MTVSHEQLQAWVPSKRTRRAGGCLPGSRRPEDSGSIVLQSCGRVVGLLPWDLYSVSTASVSTRLVPAAGLNEALNRGPCEIWVSLRGSCLAFVGKDGTKVQVLQMGSDDWVELSCAGVVGRGDSGVGGSAELQWAWMQPSDCGSSIFGLLQEAHRPQDFTVWVCSPLNEGPVAWSKVLAVRSSGVPVCSAWFKESNAAEFSLAVAYIERGREGHDILHVQIFSRGDSAAIPGNELDHATFALQDSAPPGLGGGEQHQRSQSSTGARVPHISVHWDPSGRQMAIIVASQGSDEAWLLFVSKSLVCTGKARFSAENGEGVPLSCTWINSDLLAVLSSSGDLSAVRSSSGEQELLHWHSVVSGLIPRKTPSNILSRKQRLPYSLWGKDFDKAGPLSILSVYGDGLIHLLLSDTNSIADVSVFLPHSGESSGNFTVLANSVLDKEEHASAEGIEAIQRFGHECQNLLRLAVHNESVHPQLVDLVRILQRSFLSTGRSSSALAFTGKCNEIVRGAETPGQALSPASRSLCANFWHSLAAISCLEEAANRYEATVEIAMDRVRDLSCASTSVSSAAGKVLKDVERGNEHFSVGDFASASSCYVAAQESGIILPLISYRIHSYDFGEVMQVLEEAYGADAPAADRSENEPALGVDIQLREASWWLGKLLDQVLSGESGSHASFPYPSSWFIQGTNAGTELNPEPVCFRLDLGKLKEALSKPGGLPLELSKAAWLQIFGGVSPPCPDRLKWAAGIWHRHGEWAKSAFVSSEAARHAANGTRSTLTDYARGLFGAKIKDLLQKDICLRHTLELCRCIRLAEQLDIPDMYFSLISGALGHLGSAQIDRVVRIDLLTAFQLGATASWSYCDAQILAAEIILVLPHLDQVIGVPGFPESAFAHMRGDAIDLPSLGFSSVSGAVERALKTTVQALWVIESWEQMWADYAELQNFIASDGDPSEVEGFIFGLLLASAKLLQCDRYHPSTQLHASILDMWIDLPESCLVSAIPAVLLHFIPGNKPAGSSVKKWRQLKAKCDNAPVHSSEERETIDAIENFISDQFNASCKGFCRAREESKFGLGNSSSESRSVDGPKTCLETAVEIISSIPTDDLDISGDGFEKCVKYPFGGSVSTDRDAAAVIMEIFLPGGESSSEGSSFSDSIYTDIDSIDEERSSEVNEAIEEMLANVMSGISSDESPWKEQEGSLVGTCANVSTGSLPEQPSMGPELVIELGGMPEPEPEPKPEPELELEPKPEPELEPEPKPELEPEPESEPEPEPEPEPRFGAALEPDDDTAEDSILLEAEEIVSQIISQMGGDNSDSDSGLRSLSGENLLEGSKHLEASGTGSPADSGDSDGVSSSPNIGGRQGQERESESELSSPCTSSPTLPVFTGCPDSLAVPKLPSTCGSSKGSVTDRSSPDTASEATEDTHDSQEKIQKNKRNISRDSPKLLTPVTQIGIVHATPAPTLEDSEHSTSPSGESSRRSNEGSEGKDGSLVPLDKDENETTGGTLPTRNISRDEPHVLTPLTQMRVPSASLEAPMEILGKDNHGSSESPSEEAQVQRSGRVAELIEALEVALAEQGREAEDSDQDFSDHSSDGEDSREDGSEGSRGQSGSSTPSGHASVSHASGASSSFSGSPAQRMFRERLDRLHSLVEGFASTGSGVSEGGENALAQQWAQARKTLEEMQEITDKKIEQSTIHLEALEPLGLPTVYTDGERAPRASRRLNQKPLKRPKPRHITPWEEDMLTLCGRGGIEPFESAAETARVRGRKFKRYTSSARGQSSEHGKIPVPAAEEGEQFALQREAAASPSVEAEADSRNSESAFSFGMKKAGDQSSPVPSVSVGPRKHTPPSPTPNADRRVLNDIYQELNTLKSQVQGSFPIMSKLSAYLESHEAEGRAQSGSYRGSESALDVPLRPSLEPKSPSRFQDAGTSPKLPRGSFKQPAKTPAFATPVSSPSPNKDTVPSRFGYNGDRVKAMMAKLKAEKFKPRHGIFAPDIDIEPLPTGDTDATEVEEERKETQRAIETLQEPFEKIMGQIEYQHSLSSSRQPLNFDDPISNEDIERVLAEVSTIILEEPPSPAVKLPKGSVHPKYEDIQEEKAAEWAAPEPASPSGSASSAVIHAYVDAEASDFASVDPARVIHEVRGGGNGSGARLKVADKEEEATGAPKTTDTDSPEDEVVMGGAEGDEAAKSGSTEGGAGTQRLMRSDSAGPTSGSGPAWFKDPFSMVFRILKMDKDSAQKAFRIASCGRTFVYRNDVTSIYALLLDKITLQQLAYIDLLWETCTMAGNLSVDVEISMELFMQVTRDAHFARSAEHLPSGTLSNSLQCASELRSKVLEEIENLGAKPGSMPIKTCMKALLNLAGGAVSSREACFVLVRLHRAAGCDTEGFMDLESLIAAVQLGPRSDNQDVGVENDSGNEEVQREASALAIQGAFRSWLRHSKYSEPPAAPEASDSGETGPVEGVMTASREGDTGAQPDSVGEDQSCLVPESKSVFESSPQLEGTFKPRPNQPRDADLPTNAGEEARQQQLNQTSAKPAGASPEESRVEPPAAEHDRWSSASFLEQYVEVEAERKAAEDRANRRSQRAHDKHAASVRLSAAQRAARAAEARVIASQKKLQEAKRKEMALLAKDVAKALGEVDKIAKDMESEAIETNRMMQAYEDERKKRNQDYMGVIAKQIKVLEGRIEEEVVREEASAFL